MSGWGDSNSRPLDPQSSALTKLRHSPKPWIGKATGLQPTNHPDDAFDQPPAEIGSNRHYQHPKVPRRPLDTGCGKVLIVDGVTTIGALAVGQVVLGHEVVAGIAPRHRTSVPLGWLSPTSRRGEAPRRPSRRSAGHRRTPVPPRPASWSEPRVMRLVHAGSWRPRHPRRTSRRRCGPRPVHRCR